MSRFTEAEYGDMMQDLITRLRDETVIGSHGRGYDPDGPSNLIPLAQAARVAIAYIETREFEPLPEREPRKCASGKHEDDYFACHCMTPEQQAQMVKIMSEWDERLAEEKADGLHDCPFCGEDMGTANLYAHTYKYHPEMRMGGPRVWSTVWHGPRDI